MARRGFCWFFEFMQTKICVVGLGYVGLPLASLLSKKYQVFGFDNNGEKIAALKQGIDETGEVENLKQYQIEFSSDPAIIQKANFIIIAIPTPIDEAKNPDLTAVKSASKTVGQNLTKGSVVVYESTVYPGCTEEICLPILAEESGLKFGADFKIGYSPERVNPGDKTHTIDQVVKVVSGSDLKALEQVAQVYGSITKIHQASSIQVAEAAKVIENVQRDLNIALMNELALIFDRLGINTKEVIEAAGTKWNFHKYYPGLVGGHCIGVDPYYLTYKAKKLGYDPKVILAGREVNELMAEFVASKLKDRKKVLVMGLTFKENIPDVRNSKAKDLVEALRKRGSEIRGHDPKMTKTALLKTALRLSDSELLINWPPREQFDAIVMFSPHDIFKQPEYSVQNLKKICRPDAVLFDLKGFYHQAEAERLGFKYLTL